MKNILAKTGLTSSEANHVTNIVKELVKDLDAKSSNMPLTTSKVIRNGEELPMDTHVRVEDWKELILKRGKLYSLSAWLKSGIKLKERELDSIEYSDFDGDIPQEPLEKMPRTPETSFDVYLDSLSTKDRNDYLSNEAMAAHVGNFVHNFDRVRNEFDKFVPTGFQKLDDEVVTIKTEQLYTKAEVLNGFFELQKEHREAEKKVNYYKAQHKDWEKAILDAHSEVVNGVNSRNKDIKIKNNQVATSILSTFEADKRKKKKEISALRILIPKALQSTLDEVNEYAKK